MDPCALLRLEGRRGWGGERRVEETCSPGALEGLSRVETGL